MNTFKLMCSLLLSGVSLVSASAQNAITPAIKQGVQIPIWQGAAPGSEQWTLPEQRQTTKAGKQQIINVTQPTITVFYPKPRVAVGTAVIVAQGGGFRTLPDPTEQDDLVKTLTGRGVTVVVLKYRLMQNTDEEQAYRAKLGTSLTADDINRDLAGDYMKSIRKISAEDGRQAIRFVRQNAAALGVKPDRVGVIGFSSGGVLANTVGIEYDTATRPDFIAVFYGSPPDLSMNVPVGAPPHYIATVSDDALTWKGSLLRFEEWNRAGAPVELHIYGNGGHGFRNGKSGDTINRWQSDFCDWLRQRGLLTASR